MEIRSLIFALLFTPVAFGQTEAVKVNATTSVLVKPTASQFGTANGFFSTSGSPVPLANGGTGESIVEATAGQAGYYGVTFANATAGQELVVVVSPDGIIWKPVAGPGTYTDPDGYTLRAPRILYWNGKYYVAYTANAFVAGDFHFFRIAESPDLIHWTKTVDVDFSAVSGCKRVWGPKFTVDGTTLRVYVATCGNDGSNQASGNFTPYEVHATASNLSTWSAPTQVTGTSFPASMFDMSVLKTGSTYRMAFRNITSEGVYYTSSSSPTSSFSSPTDTSIAGGPYAGCELIETTSGHYRLYLDKYTYLGYYYSETTDFATWSAAVALKLPFSFANMGVVRTASEIQNRNLSLAAISNPSPFVYGSSGYTGYGKFTGYSVPLFSHEFHSEDDINPLWINWLPPSGSYTAINTSDRDVYWVRGAGGGTQNIARFIAGSQNTQWNGNMLVDGTFDLGNSSDTTIARVSAGVISVEGATVYTQGGALGTPITGNLSNCTALPVAGITASTSTALGVGSVELGHATDTTIARVSAGLISVEGATVYAQGGALGTPASGTLTNCTGYPTSTLVAEQATTSGTTITFGSIPAGVHTIKVMFNGVSTNGTSEPLIQIGDAGGIENTGYASISSSLAASAVTSSSATVGWNLKQANASAVLCGCVTLSRQNATHTWAISGNLARSDSVVCETMSGNKTLSAELTQLTITTTNGTDAFDLGAASISYQK